MANDVDAPDIEGQMKRIEDLAKTEDRPIAELVADMVELYIKRKSLNADLRELVAEGRTYAEQLGYKPRTDTQAMDLVNKKRQELRAEDKRCK